MIRAGIESVSGNVSDLDEFFEKQRESFQKNKLYYSLIFSKQSYTFSFNMKIFILKIYNNIFKIFICRFKLNYFWRFSFKKFNSYFIFKSCNNNISISYIIVFLTAIKSSSIIPTSFILNLLLLKNNQNLNQKIYLDSLLFFDIFFSKVGEPAATRPITGYSLLLDVNLLSLFDNRNTS